MDKRFLAQQLADKMRSGSKTIAAPKTRGEQIRHAISVVEAFHPPKFPSHARIGLGAIVEVEDEDTGDGKTFFIAPAGAGVELTGPGGDGHLTVITPRSPMGLAVAGLEVGDSFDVTAAGEVRSWEITWVG